jgi:hypothetical protein
MPSARLALSALWCVALLLVPLPGGAARAADPEPPRDVLIRGGRDIPQSVERVLTDPALSSVGTVIFAFEASTFAPPPGRTEFSAFYGFQNDVAAWVKALVAAAARPTHHHLFALTSLRTDVIDLSRPAAERSLTQALTYRWAKDDKGPDFAPAARWMAEAVRDARKISKSERCALVYVADRVLPERVFEHAEDVERERGWRRRLVEAGTYFDEEAVGRKLAELRAAFFVVAPEAHFEDFTPVAELPSFPWAARPEILSWPDFFRLELPSPLPSELPGTTPPDGPPEGSPGPPPPSEPEMTEEELEELIKNLPPETPEFVKQLLRHQLEELRKQKKGKRKPPAPADPAPPRPPDDLPTPPMPPMPPEGELPEDEPPPFTLPEDLPFPELPGFPSAPNWGGKGRFRSTTPTWFPTVGYRTPWCNHAPSAYGHWPFARAAALTGGRYLFYPFPPGTWLDVCPSAAPQIADLAPELVKRSEFARLGAGDPAWDALDRAARSLVEDTPWEDGMLSERWASGWGSFMARKPVQFEKRWEARRRPCDDVLGSAQGHEGELRRLGERLLEQVVPLYTQAIRDVDESLTTLRGPQAPKAHMRGMADLTLGRFWLAMSRFHLHALGLYMKEIERFKPDDPKESVDRYVVTYVPTIRMSDVLDAYDGRTLGAEGETKYQGRKIPGVKCQQGNILDIPVTNPDYRAKREQAHVLEQLDERLRPNALDMIEAARAVMARYARTPWGWTTYYSDAYTFVWTPVPPTRGSVGPMGGVGPTPPSEEPDAPTTPPGGGSTPGAPSTPGGR